MNQAVVVITCFIEWADTWINKTEDPEYKKALAEFSNSCKNLLKFLG